MLNITGFMFFSVIGLKLYLSLNGEYFGFILGFVISSLISYFVVDKFNYSDNIIINLLQRALFIFMFIFFGLIVYFVFMFYFDLFPVIECSSINESDHISSKSSANNISSSTSSSNSIKSNIISAVECTESNKSTYEIKIDKDKLDSLIDGAVYAVNTIVTNVIPNIGAGAAAGAVGSAIVKATVNTPLGSRILAIGSTTGITAVSVQSGLNIGSQLTRNLDLNNLVKDSPHVTSDKNTIPSPTDSNFIFSVLENT